MDYHPTKFAIKIPMKPTHLGNLGSVQHVFVVITGVGFFRTKIQTYFAGEDWTLDIQYGMGIRLGLFFAVGICGCDQVVVVDPGVGSNHV